jgi:hypothetical protein
MAGEIARMDADVIELIQENRYILSAIACYALAIAALVWLVWSACKQ